MSAKLFVQPKTEGRVLLTVGGTGIAQSIQIADLITLCFRRVAATAAPPAAPKPAG